MSDPMTNREIEDVLTSIRRLVAQEGQRGIDSSRLILTEAQRVLDAGQPMPEAPQSAPAEPDSASAESEDQVESAQAAPRAQTDMPAPDFGKLEATIAELEAAVSANGDGWETEVEEPAPKASNVTELYGRLSFNRRDAGAAPKAADPEAAAASRPPRVDAHSDTAPDMALDTAPDTAVTPDPAPINAAPVDQSPVQTPETVTPVAPIQPRAAEEISADAVDSADPALDNGPNGAAPADDAEILDEEMLRAVVAQMVRDELHGQLGEKITQQVRKLVRSEIAKALSERSLI